MEHLPPPDTFHAIGDGKVMPPASQSFWQRASGLLLQALAGLVAGLLPLAWMVFYMILASNTYHQNRYLSYSYYCRVPAGFLAGLLVDIEIALLCFQGQKARLTSWWIVGTFGASMTIIFLLFIGWAFGSDSYMGVVH